MNAMAIENPALLRYLASFEAALKRYDCADADDIVRDLKGHIEEAQAMGKPLDDVLRSIGPAEALARAYAVELELNPRGDKRLRGIGGALRVAGILAAASLVSLIVVTTLGSIGFAFLLSGVVLLVVGALEAGGVHLPYVQLAGVSPVLVMSIGPLLGVVGYMACWGLWLYLKALARTLTRNLPGRRAT
ncbi:MAG: hypothetical protein R3C16_03175 [Hyphomonadaceae bacterium]